MKSNAKQIILMMLVWAASLILYDRLFNKHLFVPTAEAMKEFTKPQVRMWINHFCCSGCADGTFGALKTLSWLDKPQIAEGERLLTMQQANSVQPRSSYGKGVVVNVRDVPMVDFVQLKDTLRRSGMVAGEIEFGGLPHFSLKVDVGRHMCCRLCVKAIEEALIPKEDPKFGGTLQWLEGSRVNQVSKSITAFVKTGHAADIGELMRVLDQAGFPPAAIRVIVERKEDLMFAPK